MRNGRSMVVAAMFVAMLAIPVSAVWGAAGPEDTLKQYLEALKAGKFEDAYKFVSKGMAGNKDEEVWAKEQRTLFQTCEVKVFKFQLFPAQQQGDATAKVPNILSSQDKCANQLGADEYELYTLIKENGQWKIDQQEQVDKADQAKWFKK